MADRYYLCAQGGQVEGPFEAEVVRGWVAAGQIHVGTQVCPEGEESWRPLSAFPELLAPGAAAVPPPPRHHTSAAAGRVSLVGPILVTVFCCLIGGIVSIVYAAQANTAAAGGDLEVAMNRRERIEASIPKKRGDEKKALEAEFPLIVAVIEQLEAEKDLLELDLDRDAQRRLRGFQFLSAKPRLVVENQSEGQELRVEGAVPGCLALELDIADANAPPVVFSIRFAPADNDVRPKVTHRNRFRRVGVEVFRQGAFHAPFAMPDQAQ